MMLGAFLVRWIRLAAAFVIGAFAISCALHRSSGSSNNSRTAITAAEIDSVHALNAYDAVHRLRPQMLANRGQVSLDPRQPPSMPNVYVDNMYYGDISTLRSIVAATIDTIKFYNAAEAQYTFGRGNAAGVIGIITKH
jgi:hypothetical protein